MKGYCIIVYS
jgi:hypothetical protein